MSGVVRKKISIAWAIAFSLPFLVASCDRPIATTGDRSTPGSIAASPLLLPSPTATLTPDLSPLPTPAAMARSNPALAPAEIWSLLRQESGVVVMLRHAIAPGSGDPPNFRLEDCSTQRNLSEAGRQQARQIGAIFRQQQIPVARVLSSQWCRCLETARLMDLAPVEPFPALNSFFGDRSTEAQQTAVVKRLIDQNSNTPGVTILVTHQVNITAVTGVVPQSGEALILRADQPDQPQVIGQLPFTPSP